MAVVLNTQAGMRQRAVTALKRTWQAIASDVLDSMFAANAGQLDSADIIHIISQSGFHHGWMQDHGGDYEATIWLETRPEWLQNAILQEAFPANQFHGRFEYHR
jgi:hypothetical protein